MSKCSWRRAYTRFRCDYAYPGRQLYPHRPATLIRLRASPRPGYSAATHRSRMAGPRVRKLELEAERQSATHIHPVPARLRSYRWTTQTASARRSRALTRLKSSWPLMTPSYPNHALWMTIARLRPHAASSQNDRRPLPEMASPSSSVAHDSRSLRGHAFDVHVHRHARFHDHGHEAAPGPGAETNTRRIHSTSTSLEQSLPVVACLRHPFSPACILAGLLRRRPRAPRRARSSYRPRLPWPALFAPGTPRTLSSNPLAAWACCGAPTTFLPCRVSSRLRADVWRHVASCGVISCGVISCGVVSGSATLWDVVRFGRGGEVAWWRRVVGSVRGRR